MVDTPGCGPGVERREGSSPFVQPNEIDNRVGKY